MSEQDNILVVDDEPYVVRAISFVFREAGYKVLQARDGQEALDIIRESRPKVVFLDIMLPEKDGYEVCGELKQDEKYSEIPIVLLTAVSTHVGTTQYSHYYGMSTEADDYLPKPASAEEITESVKSLLGV